MIIYRDYRNELSKRRARFGKDNSSETIKIDIDAHADCSDLKDALHKILGIESFSKDLQEIVHRIHPEESQSWGWNRLDEVIEELRRVQAGESPPWTERDRRFRTALKRVPPERLDRLALYHPKDAVRVRFRDKAVGGMKSIRQGSPGQQTAALLAFVLGYGSEPIILDQPEDDLDNTIIYDVLIRRLREIKPQRQVIIVTHNPNIVVLGDAEYVISLEARKGQSHINCHGGLQEQEVRDEICRVMEGGREAFESRYRRIIPPK